MSGEEKSLASRVVDEMFNHDPFSQWLGIERVEESAGKSVLKMQVREEMLNGFDIAHGGITYALADSALAFASNGHGTKAVSVETSISHLRPLKPGEWITATTEELSCTTKIGVYQVTITNEDMETVALFKGTVYRTGKEWFSKANNE